MAKIEVLKTPKVAIEEPPVIHLTLGNPVYKGAKGDKGDTGLTGPKGEPGKSGVYIGTEAPTDEGMVVWIDITGDAELQPAEGGSY